MRGGYRWLGQGKKTGERGTGEHVGGERRQGNR